MTTLQTAIPPVEERLTPSGAAAADRAASAELLAAVATDVTGRPVDPGPVIMSSVPYAYGSPATGGLFRVGGRDRDGGRWSLFVKVLQHLRHWPGLVGLPPGVAAQFAAEFPWRDELTSSPPSSPTGCLRGWGCRGSVG